MSESFTHRGEYVPPVIQASYKLANYEYGVRNEDGEVIWFSDGRLEDSLPDALHYLDTFNDEGVALMERAVSAGWEVNHVRFRSRGCGWE